MSTLGFVFPRPDQGWLPHFSKVYIVGASNWDITTFLDDPKFSI